MKVRGFNVFFLAFLAATLLTACVGFATRSEPARRSLVSAARRGDVTTMRLWLLAGARVNAWAPEEGGGGRWASPLVAAIQGGQAEAVRFLLAHGAEVSGVHLSSAAEHGTPEIRDLLLTESHGRRVCRSRGGGDMLLAASAAGREEIVRLLLSSGCGDGSWGEGGGWGVKETALRRAVVQRHRGVVAALLEAGADVNHLSESEIALGGISVLQVALNHNDPEIIALVRQAGAK